jgi:prepilin-type N-terminal cleavage/methylation domain-containing protein
MKTLPRTKAFSLIELLVVMSIGLLLMIMAIPSFSRLARKSKVQQAAETVVTVMNMATTISKQLCKPEAVVVYFGDDFTGVTTKPISGVLPKYGNIEIWTARMGLEGQKSPYGVAALYWSNAPPIWTPFYQPLEPLTLDSFTFPEGVRILTGYAKPNNVLDVPLQYKFTFNSFFASSPIGEIKRHSLALVDGVGFPQGVDSGYSYSDVLIFDTTTGEHLIVRAICPTNKSSKLGGDYKARILTEATSHENSQVKFIVKPLRSNLPDGLGRVALLPAIPVVNKNIQAIIDN